MSLADPAINHPPEAAPQPPPQLVCACGLLMDGTV